MVTYAELEAEADKLKQLAKDGKNGLLFKKTPTGVILRNMNARGEPIRFNAIQIAFLWERFPEIRDALTRNMETMRRVQGVKARLARIIGNGPGGKGSSTVPAELLPAGLPPLPAAPKTVYEFAESLDPDRPIPANLSDLNAADPARLPTFYTYVDMTNPEKPVRVIFQTEFNVLNNRTDEAVIRYTVGADELKELKAGKRLSTDLKGFTVSNMKVFYFDLNGLLSGQRLLDHHKKTLTTLQNATLKFLNDFEVKVAGDVTFSSKEVYLASHHANITDLGQKGIRASLGREAVGAEEAIDKATTVTFRTRVVEKNGVPVVEMLQSEMMGMKRLRGLSPQQIENFVTHLGKVGDTLLNALKKSI